LYICICGSVTESEVSASIGRGNKTLAQIKRDLPVCKMCGICRDDVIRMLRERGYGICQNGKEE